MRWLRYFLTGLKLEYQKNRLKLFLQFISMLVVIAVGVLGLFDIGNTIQSEAKRRENLSYTQQVENLNKVQESLNDLTQFVELQRERLKESEDIVNNLKTEHEKLKPVVEADRKTIEALFDLQYQKSRSDIWKERGIGFILGVLGSVVASFIYGLMSRFRNRRNQVATPPA